MNEWGPFLHGAPPPARVTPASESSARARRRLSAQYRPSIRCAVIWLGVLVLWSGAILDMGESLHALILALGGYVALVVLVMLRRPATPTKLDLLLVGWALPILFLALLLGVMKRAEI